MQRSHRTYVGVVVVVFLAISYIINILFVLVTLDNLYDFGSFIASGQFANAGKNPYSDDSPLILAVHFDKLQHQGIALNLNPPISVLIFQIVANFHPLKAILVWRVISVILFVASASLLIKQHPWDGTTSLMRFAWAVGLAGLWHSVQLGQIYPLVLLITVFVWLMLGRNKSVWGGVFLGMLIAIKPNFIFWAVLLAITGKWKTFVSAGFTAAFISTIPLLFHGMDIYAQWLEASRLFTPALLIFPGNNSLQGLFARFGAPQVGVILSATLALMILSYGYRNKPPIREINSLGIVTSLLISPIAWTGYTILTLPIFFERERWHWTQWIAAFIFAIPSYFPVTLFQESFFHFVFLGWFYGWGLLLLLGNLLIRKEQHAKAEN